MEESQRFFARCHLRPAERRILSNRDLKKAPQRHKRLPFLWKATSPTRFISDEKLATMLECLQLHELGSQIVLGKEVENIDWG